MDDDKAEMEEGKRCTRKREGKNQNRKMLVTCYLASACNE